MQKPRFAPLPSRRPRIADVVVSSHSAVADARTRREEAPRSRDRERGRSKRKHADDDSTRDRRRYERRDGRESGRSERRTSTREERRPTRPRHHDAHDRHPHVGSHVSRSPAHDTYASPQHLPIAHSPRFETPRGGPTPPTHWSSTRAREQPLFYSPSTAEFALAHAWQSPGSLSDGFWPSQSPFAYAHPHPRTPHSANSARAEYATPGHANYAHRNERMASPYRAEGSPLVFDSFAGIERDLEFENRNSSEHRYRY
jgi:hypothetical protein